MTRRYPFDLVALTLTLFVALLLSANKYPLNAQEPTVIRQAIQTNLESGFKRIEPTRDVSPYNDGYELVDGAFKCQTLGYGENARGVSLGYQLDQKEAKAIVATCMSRAEGVKGNVDNGYSLYLDVVYDDGTPLWGQTYSFPVGDADWSEGKVVVFPAKPIKYVSMYGIYRGHVGTVYFKNFALYEQEKADGACDFDFVGSTACRSSINGTKIMFRNAMEGSDLIGVNADKHATEALFDDVLVRKSIVKLSTGIDEIILDLKSRTDHDVSFTLYYSLPLPELDVDAEWVWFDSPRNSRALGNLECRTTRDVVEVGKGKISHYPFGVVAQRYKKGSETRWGTAFGVGLNPHFPAVYRIVANGSTNELYIAYDLALTKEKPEIQLRLLPLCWTLKTPTSSDLIPISFKEYCVKSVSNTPLGSTPFRAAYDVWRRAFPEAFRVRAQKQGNWMAFANISNVDNWEDFGFAFKEGINEPSEDDARGITTFRYTEPMTWWQTIPKSEGMTKSRESALDAAKTLALKASEKPDGSLEYHVAEARALFTTGMHNSEGEFAGILLDTPWCDGVVWSINDAPGLVELTRLGKLSNPEGIEPTAGFELKWNETIANNELGEPLPLDQLPKTREEYIAAQTSDGIDGEYIDSSEGYVTSVLDYTRNYFEGMTTPLTFDSKNLRPAIFRGLVAYEYVRKISEDVHARGALTMANATPSLHFWLVPLLDVVGTETNWNYDDQWRPMPDDELMFRRLLCGGKPYCFLMNTDFDNFDHACSERYMKRAIAYGMFPSYFSADASTLHYFENPELYERDRPLFKKYMPLVIRIAQNGWEPEPCAESSKPEIYIERFGALPNASVASNPLSNDNSIYLTLFNDSNETKDYAVTLAPDLLDFIHSTHATIHEEIDNLDITLDEENRIRGSIHAQDVKVLHLIPQ